MSKNFIFGKFTGDNLNMTIDFQNSSLKYPNKAFFVSNLSIFVLLQNFAIRKFSRH